MSKRTRALSRRTFLRGSLATGAAVTVGMPVLEAMLNLNGTALADGTAPPKRFVLWFWGNGTHPGGWAPAEIGPGWTPTPLLSGLADLTAEVSLVSGTSLPVKKNNNPHVEGVVGILAGGNPLMDPSFDGSQNDWDYMTVPGPTLDEVATGPLGETSYHSLVLAVTPLHGVNGPGTAVRYTSHVGPYLFNAPTFEPAEVFAKLFADGKATSPVGPTPEDLARASVLDAVLADAGSLRKRLGQTDKVRLDAHLEAVRDIEKRVSGLSYNPGGVACEQPVAPPDAASYRERAKLMGELAAMALACDLTRVVSMEFSSPASHSGYPDIFPQGLQYNGAPISFHEYEHNAGYTESTLTALSYFVDVYGDFVRTLRETPEAAGNLLDHTLVLGTSEVSGGAEHGFDDFPLLIAGRAGGSFKSGHHVHLPGANSARVPLTILKALGWQGTTWGTEQISTSDPIGELLV